MKDKSVTYEVSYREAYDGTRFYKTTCHMQTLFNNETIRTSSRELRDIFEDRSIKEFVEKMQYQPISDELFEQFDLTLQMALAKATGVADIQTAYFEIKDKTQAFKTSGFFLLFIPSWYLLMDPRITQLIKYWVTDRPRIYRYNIRLIMSKNVLNEFDQTIIESAYGTYGDHVNICAKTTDQFANELKNLLWIR